VLESGALGLDSATYDIDTGALYALADRKDAWHRRCAAFVDGFEGRLLVPSTVIPEACYLLGNHLGARAELAFVRSLAQGELPVANLSGQDLTRCVALLKTYEDAAIGFVDASVAAIAERLKITGIVTTDRRHFSIIKAAGGRSYTLLP
jgi:predicted nucleic acid-binding protein